MLQHVKEKCIIMCLFFLDRQSEPLLRPDAKDHSSSVFQQFETHRGGDSNSNPGKRTKGNMFSDNGVGLQDISSSSTIPFLHSQLYNMLITVFVVVVPNSSNV